MSTIVQRRFAFHSDLSPRRPLLPIGAVMAWLDVDEDTATYLAEDGTLIAINIATSGSRRRELRFWRDSVLAQALRSRGHQVDIRTPEDLPHAIIGHHRPALRATEVRRILSCSQAHIAALILEGAIIATNIPSVRSGPNASPSISRSSIEQFIIKRIIA